MNGFSRAKSLLGLRSFVTVGGAVGVLFSTSCARAVDTDAMARELTRLDDAWSKAAATRSGDSVGSFYAADAIAYPPDEPVAVGHDAATHGWASAFADSSYAISWTTDHASVSQSGDLGFTAGTYEDSFRRPDGTRVTEKGKYVCIWKRQADGTWKAFRDIWNTDSR
jgi:ketosteroid isomerase-like protein